MFVTAEPVNRIHKAIEKAGLNFVMEAVETFQPDNLFFYEGAASRQLEGRLYVTMPTEAALRTLLSLYDKYKSDEKFDQGLTAMRDLFALLKEIRPWSMRERISDDTAQALADRLTKEAGARLRIEVEIYPSATQAARNRAIQSFGSDAVILRETRIPEIHYHGLLIEISPEVARQVAQRVADGPGSNDDIFLIEPHSVVQAERSVSASLNWTPTGRDRPLPQGPCRAAVLDGVPIAAHPMLHGRLELLDSGQAGQRVPLDQRHHGTAITSLILHGELDADEPSLSSPLLVRPVLTHLSGPDFDGNRLEQFDSDRLTVEIVHEALTELFGENGDARATSVFVVNISLGDRNRPAVGGPVSGWARLLDWWSASTGLLFIVSTGNDQSELPLQRFATYNEADSSTTEELSNAALASLIDQRAVRPILSPAEGINILTVGAANNEHSPTPTLPSGLRDTSFPDGSPSLLARCGPGIARSVKPDVLMNGGRALGSLRAVGQSAALRWSPALLHSGQLSAGVAASPTETNPIGRSHGSSNAAALATRLAVNAVEELIGEQGAFPNGLTRTQAALLAKCMLVHGANWGDAGERAMQLFGSAFSHPEQLRRAIADVFGYGIVRPHRILSSTAQRITLLDVGLIKKDQGLVYRFRPPPCLSPTAERRRVMVSVAWFTPVQPTRRLYRQAELFADDVSSDGYALAVDADSAQPTDYHACRGTVWSQRFEGAAARSHASDETIQMRVSCREPYPGALSSKTEVPFAVALTIEVGAATGLPVFDQIMASIQAQVRLQERA